MMTPERLAELKAEVVTFSQQEDGFSERVVTECLDEIDRLDNIVTIQQKQIQRLMDARDAEILKNQRKPMNYDQLRALSWQELMDLLVRTASTFRDVPNYSQMVHDHTVVLTPPSLCLLGDFEIRARFYEPAKLERPHFEAGDHTDPLPSVAGSMEMRHVDFQRACQLEIGRLQELPQCDTRLIYLLCEAVRCSRECCDLVRMPGPFPDRTAPEPPAAA